MMLFVVVERFKVNPGYEEMCEERFLDALRCIPSEQGEVA
jgi:heme-degrading monooxygenase HmoA